MHLLNSSPPKRGDKIEVARLEMPPEESNEGSEGGGAEGSIVFPPSAQLIKSSCGDFGSPSAFLPSFSFADFSSSFFSMSLSEPSLTSEASPSPPSSLSN